MTTSNNFPTVSRYDFLDPPAPSIYTRPSVKDSSKIGVGNLFDGGLRKLVAAAKAAEEANQPSSPQAASTEEDEESPTRFYARHKVYVALFPPTKL
ncbi:unnamed protein product [Cylicostephanus goldi]|uniref:Uncharacterized protein n=1 Tax=Cylicostephanus goldi TaxID=71465 RepID=A0A3P7MJY4_CYLGO|nr:unnamed protein product [Cylicostephanus goldi]